MLVDFNKMPDQAKVWIYQADRPFTNVEEKLIRERSQSFIETWAAHGQPLAGSYQLLHHQFLVIAVDESLNGASGCSIDASVGLIRDLQSNLQLDFLDRSKVAFMVDDQVFLHRLTELKQVVAEGVVNENTRLFNNSIDTLGEWKTSWITPARESWMKRYFA
ncbi:MAG: hypothetical protein KI790_06055 [Cyclobacteriaceae bacterium]|nr:hypothetical protein [Cyclobacteriaceae bacterium HetDA_MAG_MS6]